MRQQSSFSALVIDDDPSARNILERYLESDGRVTVYPGLESTAKATETIELLSPDVIFLDINMPYENGLQFGTRLKKTQNKALLIFCTAFKNYALDAFDLKPFDFLVKPFGFDEIVRLIDNVENEISDQRESTVQIENSHPTGKFKFEITNGYVYLKPSEILYITSSNKSRKLYTLNGEEIRITKPISLLQEYLGKSNFLKVNRSTLVNVEYIASVDRRKKICCLKANNIEKEFAVSKIDIVDIEDLLILKIV